MDKAQNPKKTGDEILRWMHEDADAAVIYIYDNYQEMFIRWATKYYDIDVPATEDLFQEIVIIFHENVISQRLKTLEAQVSTYLFKIGSNLLSKRKRQKQKENTTYLEDFSRLNLKDWDLDIFTVEEEGKELEFLLELAIMAFGQLKEKCQKLLRLSIFGKKPHKEIAKLLGYSSADVSRRRKVECLKQLISIFNKLKKDEGED